jgi:hypothetical protein
LPLAGDLVRRLGEEGASAEGCFRVMPQSIPYLLHCSNLIWIAKAPHLWVM